MNPDSINGLFSRRSFLRAGTLGLSSFGLSDLFRLQAAAAPGAPSGASDPAVIFIWLAGGPPHMETYDMKPDAPSDYRGAFRPIRTNVPGMEVCELLPMGAIEETAVEWHDGESYVVSITPMAKAPPFKQARARLALKEENGGTRASMNVEYTLKYGVLGKLMDALMVRSQFQKAIPGVLRGLKHYTETGEEVTPDVLRRVRKTHQSGASSPRLHQHSS